MKKLLGFLLCTILGCLILAQTAVAVPYQVEVGDYIYLTAYNSEVMAGVMTFDIKDENKVKYGSWGTFCLEYGETTWVRTDYLINDLVEGSWDNWDAIAWLYYNWDQGTLGFEASQSDLQRAFWDLNGELDSNDSLVNSIVNIAISESGTWVNDGKVLVAVNNGQDVLVSAAPVPEPATLLLLGTGLIGLAGFSRKIFKK